MTSLYIFDLDGTLIDSRQDLIDSVNATRRYLGLGDLAGDVISSYVGDGVRTLIQRALGGDPSAGDLERGVAYFIRYYREHMLDSTRPYPGVEEGLSRIAAAGVPMAVLTNKPVRFSRDIIAKLGWSEYFFRVYGGDSFEEKKPHPAGAHALIGEARAEPARTVMVGDSAVDVRTARAAGIAACGVTYGLAPESFKAHPPDIIVDTLAVLPDRLDEWWAAAARTG